MMDRAEKAEKLLALFEAGEVELSMNMNDVFGFACSESEEVWFNGELEPVLRLFDEFGEDGLVAYACVRRGMTELPANPAYHTDAFRAMLVRAKEIGMISLDDTCAKLRALHTMNL